MIYSISNSRRGLFNGRRGGGDPATLRKFSEETGGALFFVDDQEGFKEVFDQITRELRSQYSLGYVPTNSARDGTFRKIEVRSKNGYKIQARAGYYAIAKRD